MKRIMILVVLLICFCGQAFAQNALYVSAKGSDDNDGLTEATALQSLDVATLLATVKGINVIVIGTLTMGNAMVYEKGHNSIFRFAGADDRRQVIVSGKPGATGSDRAVLSGKGTDQNVVILVSIRKDANIRFENIEITGLVHENTTGIGIEEGGRVTLGPGAVVRGNDVGIIISDGTCVIDGGEVRDNGRPGIICGENGVLTMLGGVIRNNGDSGVAVLKGGRFTMSGGTITDNTGTVAGGGVLVAAGGRFDQTGGTVSGNTAPRYANIYRVSGALGSSSTSGSSSSSVSSSSSGSSSSGSSGSSSKSSSGFNWNIPLYTGFYLQGWHQNLFSAGVPLQVGVELDFGKNISLALLGEADGSLGYPYLLEGNLGGMAELYFANKTIGIGMGFGSSTAFLPVSSLITSYEPGEEPADTVTSTYMRFAFILRKESKTSFFAQYYSNGDWGFGVQFGWNLF